MWGLHACRERRELAGVLQDVAWNGRRHRCTFHVWVVNRQVGIGLAVGQLLGLSSLLKRFFLGPAFGLGKKARWALIWALGPTQIKTIKIIITIRHNN